MLNLVNKMEERVLTRNQISARIAVLRQELEKGQVELQNLEKRRVYLHETTLRISGAIRVLNEILTEELLVDGGADIDV